MQIKKITGAVFLLALLCLCIGCRTEKGQTNSDNIATITEAPKNEVEESWHSATGQGDPAKEEALLNNRERIIEKMGLLETKKLSGLDLYADKEVSLLNSNVLHNYGYLTYDEDGTIYFADRNIGGIFVSDWNGKNRWQLTPDSGKNLQIVGKWLYYLSTGKNCIRRIHMESLEMEVVWEQECEAFLLWKEKLYINGVDGFYKAEPDGTNHTLLHDQSLMMHRLQVAENGLWLGNAFNGDDYVFMLEGHLLLYDERKNVWCYTEDGLMDPLLAGKRICYGSGRKKVLDLETDIETEINFFDDNCVSDGTFWYACSGFDELKIMYRFDGAEKTELFCMKSELHARNKFLTPNMLYWMLESTGEDWLYELWYYNLETGELGQVY